MNITT